MKTSKLLNILSVVLILTILINGYTFLKEQYYVFNINLLEDVFVVCWSSIFCFAMCFAGSRMPASSFKKHLMLWSFTPNLVLMLLFALYIGVGFFDKQMNEAGLILMFPLFYPFFIIPVSAILGSIIWFSKKFITAK